MDGRKIAGILVERALAPNPPAASPRPAAASEPAWGALIGIGLNANLAREDFPPELAALATSLQIERGGAPVDRSELARDLIRRLDHWYDLSRRGGPETLNAAWCQRSEHLGRVGQSRNVFRKCRRSSGRSRRPLRSHARALPPGSRSAVKSSPPVRRRISPWPSCRFDRVATTATHVPASSPIRDPNDSLAPLAKLPLADIRSIEPFAENRPASGDGSGFVRPRKWNCPR